MIFFLAEILPVPPTPSVGVVSLSKKIAMQSLDSVDLSCPPASAERRQKITAVPATRTTFTTQACYTLGILLFVFSILLEATLGYDTFWALIGVVPILLLGE